MNWNDIGKLVAPLAPTLGTVLFGPLGGAAGQILASALNTEATPAAVGAAIEQGGPSVREQIQRAEETAAAKWAYLAEKEKADAAQSSEINQTMRAEIAGGQPWWAWRNLWGYSVMAECSAVAVVLLWQLATGDAKALNLFAQFTGFIMSWFGMRVGVLGYIFRGASNEKIAAVTGEAPGVIGQVVKALAKR